MSAETILALLLIASLTGTLVGTVRLARHKKRFLTTVFFAFGTVSCLLSTVYWVVYTLLRPDSRMPFAANEIAEWAMFLLFASALATVYAVRRFPVGTTVCAALFAAANTALWIGWSGEWVEDILTGICFGWFLCCIAGAIRLSNALKTGEWIALGALSAVLILSQTATFFVPESIAAPLDVFCSVLTFSAGAFFFARTAIALKRGGASLPLAFSANAWAAVTMYMSGGIAYNIALVLSACSFPLILIALIKEGDAG